MKKISAFLLLLVSSVSFYSCSQGNAVAYNDAIIGEQTKIVKKALEMTSSVGTDPAKASKILQEMAMQAKASVKTVSAMEPFKGDSEFRDAAVNLFKFYLQIAENEYREMIDIIKKGENITQDDLTKLQELEKKITTEEQVLDAKMKAAQQKFSSDHNIGIKENELQKDVDAIN